MNQRDLELLSSYLDGQLKPSDSARLEARLSGDADLRAVLDDLRSARSLLRRLPLRKAPRNFTLTPKMVGKNPPLPRTYPAFRFVSALATLLFFVTLSVNFLAPQMARVAPMGGMGGGGAPDLYSSQAATEAPAAAAEAAPAIEAPAATEAPLQPPAGMAPLPTATLSVEDGARNAIETQAEKNAATEEPNVLSQAPPIQDTQSVPAEAPRSVPPIWEYVLAGIALLSALIMLGMRQMSINRWRRK